MAITKAYCHIEVSTAGLNVVFTTPSNILIFRQSFQPKPNYLVSISDLKRQSNFLVG